MAIAGRRLGEGLKFGILQKRGDDLVILSWGIWGLGKIWNPDNMHYWLKAWCLLGDDFQQKYVRPNTLPPTFPQCLAQGYSEGVCRLFQILFVRISLWVNE